MRIFVAVLGGFTGIMAMNHIFLIFVVSGIARSSSATDGVMAGIAMLGLWGIGVAAVFPYPKKAVAPFVLAGLVGIAGGQGTSFRDLTLWGIVALVLGVLSFFAVHEKERVDQQHRSASGPSISRPAPLPASATYCAQCGRSIPASSRFCQECGAPRPTDQAEREVRPPASAWPQMTGER